MYSLAKSTAKTTPQKAETTTGYLAKLAVEISQSDNFDQLSKSLKKGFEQLNFEGCFLIRCFGLNRETRFGHWQSQHVFPLQSDLSEVCASLTLRDNLIIVGSDYFTLVVDNASKHQDKEPEIGEILFLFGEAVRSWVQRYTQRVDDEFDGLNHRKASCKQLLEVVQQLDASGESVRNTHRKILSTINASIPEGLASLNLSDAEQSIILDEYDQIGRAYSISTKQQLATYDELKKQVCAIANSLLSRK